MLATDPAPADAVQGGLETTIGPPAMQYVCRTKPDGAAYEVPGKIIFGLGCYVTYANVNGEMVDYTAPADKPVDVLTPKPSCHVSWQSATTSTIPHRALDLGDTPGQPHYACHGYYTSVGSSGTQIGNVLMTSDAPPQNQCWFESFVGPQQPQDPIHFEILAQDQP
jgi:hypothetical protein